MTSQNQDDIVWAQNLNHARNNAKRRTTTTMVRGKRQRSTKNMNSYILNSFTACFGRLGTRWRWSNLQEAICTVVRRCRSKYTTDDENDGSIDCCGEASNRPKSRLVMTKRTKRRRELQSTTDVCTSPLKQCGQDHVSNCIGCPCPSNNTKYQSTDVQIGKEH